jgi:hypothetical protein
MEADGVPILERWDEPGYVAFKCLDPDGWRVEAYWEVVHPPDRSVAAPAMAPQPPSAEASDGASASS